MSRTNNKPFYSFCRVKVTKQSIDIDSKVVKISVEPNKRYKPVYYKCKGSADVIHAYER